MKKTYVNKKLLAILISSGMAITLTGCGKVSNCNIENEHIHIYHNEKNNLTKYINSEKLKVKGFDWTADYSEDIENVSLICENDFYIINDNLEYLKKIVNSNQHQREEYVINDYIYGNYYGYDYGYNYKSKKYEYFMGYHTGYHYESHWKNVDLNEYTDNKVRDITYKYKVYKINDDKSISMKFVDNFDEIDNEYIFFKKNGLVTEVISDEYYLEKEISKNYQK